MVQRVSTGATRGLQKYCHAAQSKTGEAPGLLGKWLSTRTQGKRLTVAGEGICGGMPSNRFDSSISQFTSLKG